MNIVKYVAHAAAGLAGMFILLVGVYALAGALWITEKIAESKL